ncbi:beta-N-acetylhexosaminidase [Leifsonia sp. AG29]|uniref:beta-N-acetylhexosaminidase n=1 Tax=Leifsonia sp. AG29 TaxID=2598860 RepID=UPI00131C676C|nr:beta-N-acetylhexosaminidase [Leifsonia sp. AG29]
MIVTEKTLPELLPSPRSLEWLEGECRIRSGAIDVEFVGLDHSGSRRLTRLLDFILGPRESAAGKTTLLHIERTDTGFTPEGYEVRVAEDSITLRASTTDGLGHAIQTLKQLFPVTAFSSVGLSQASLPCCVIVDEPALAWRGGLLDVARHYFPKRYLLNFIDVLAAHKYNRLQLHLTDDQGWRIHSNLFPRLNTIGAVRSGSQVTHFDEDLVLDETPHGGTYSHDDIREIVEYAAERGVVVVPEIELPGHTGALLASYPAWGSPPRERDVVTQWGIFDSLLSPLPHVEAQLKELLSEILDLFPSPWIHLGGDEGLIEEWLRDPAVTEFMRQNDIGTPRELFARFMQRLSSWLAEQGRTMVTWDDAFASDASEAAPGVVMAWRGTEVARKAADLGHDVVLAPVMPTYFDYYQAEDEREPLAIGGPVTLADVALFDPVPETWGSEASGRILGTQFQLWTELVSSQRYADYMVWPRACALAEVAWTGAPIAPAELEARLAAHLPRLDAMGVEYRPLEGPHPWQEAGRGERRHRTTESMVEKLAALDRAAESGVVAFSPERDASKEEPRVADR